MHILSVFILLLFVGDCGFASALRNQVYSLVGKKLTPKLASKYRFPTDADGRNALHHAVIIGNLSLVEFFLADSVSHTKRKDRHGLVPLRYAEQLVEEQPSIERMKIVSIVLEKTRGINKGDAKGWLPLTWSIMAGDYPRIIELRDSGARHFLFAGRGRQNPVWAAEHLQDERAIKILAEGAHERNLLQAVNHGYRKFAQAMIEQGVDVNVRYGSHNAAMKAAKAGRLDDLKMLIANGAEIDADVLFMALHSGNPKLVETVLEHNKESASKLLIGLIAGKYERDITQTLKKARATKGGRRAIRMVMETIDWATFFSKNNGLLGRASKGQAQVIGLAVNYLQDDEVIKRFFIEHVPDWTFDAIRFDNHKRFFLNEVLESVDSSKGIGKKLYQTAIDAIDRNSWATFFSKLGEKGLGSWLPNRQERAIDFAANFLRDDEAIKLLAECVPDWYYVKAINKGYQKLAQAMIDRGVNPDTVKDEDGVSRIMKLARDGQLKELQALIDNGTQIDSTILFLAISSGNPKLVDTILKHNSELAGDLVLDLMYGKINIPSKTKNTIGKVLMGGASSDEEKIYQMITKAIGESTASLPEFATIAKLQHLKEEASSNIYRDESLFSVARDQSTQQLREIIVYADANTRMKWIVDLRDIEFLKQALADGADINHRFGFNNRLTALTYAINRLTSGAPQRQALLEIITLLLAHGANPNIASDRFDRHYPIQELIVTKDHEGVRILLDHGADPNQLVSATYTEDRELIEMLIAYGADVNSDRGKEETPLKTAARLGQADLVSRYLGLGAELDDHDLHRGSAFTQAARNGHLEIVKMLHALGARTNITCSYGSPLQAARKFGHHDVVRFLEEH